MKLLNVEDLKTYFFTSKGIVRAVDGVNLKIGETERVGLVGESGCGKSTMAFSIMRLVQDPPGKIVGGKILFKGKDLMELTEDEMRDICGKEISMVFQHPLTYLNPIMKVGEQITETIILHQGLNRKESMKMAIKALNAVSIPSPHRVVDFYPFQLSGGMRQRILLAIAFSCNPSLLIADEPTSALDVTVQAQVLKLIKTLSDDFRTSLLLITHDLGIVADICDTVYVMYAGKIVEYADVFTIFENPKHPYTEELMKCVLSIDEFEDEIHSIEGIIPDLTNPPIGCRYHTRCKKTMEKCRNEEPRLIKYEKGNEVACWLYS